MIFIGLMLIALAMGFVYFDQGLLAGLSFIVGCLALLGTVLSKSGRAVKVAGKGLVKGVREDVSKADTGHPDFSVVKEGVENMADLAGHQAYAGRKQGKPYIDGSHQFKFKGLGSLSTASQKLIDTFKKVFK